MPFPVAGLFVTIGEIRSAVELARLQLTLDHDQTIAGLSVPAGSVIRFRDKAHSGVTAIELPRPSDVGRARLEGTLSWNDVTQTWSGTLSEDRLLDGLLCRAGPVELERDGSIRQCEISAPYARFGMTLPAGSNVTRGDAGRPWSLRLPPDAGLFIPVLATDAPAGITLSVADDGRLQRITSGGGQTIIVRGVPLNSMNFFLRGDQVVAAPRQTNGPAADRHDFRKKTRDLKKGNCFGRPAFIEFTLNGSTIRAFGSHSCGQADGKVVMATGT